MFIWVVSYPSTIRGSILPVCIWLYSVNAWDQGQKGWYEQTERTTLSSTSVRVRIEEMIWPFLAKCRLDCLEACWWCSPKSKISTFTDKHIWYDAAECGAAVNKLHPDILVFIVTVWSVLKQPAWGHTALPSFQFHDWKLTQLNDPNHRCSVPVVFTSFLGLVSGECEQDPAIDEEVQEPGGKWMYIYCSAEEISLSASHSFCTRERAVSAIMATLCPGWSAICWISLQFNLSECQMHQCFRSTLRGDTQFLSGNTMCWFTF